MSEIPFREPGRQKPARGVHVRPGGHNIVWTTVCTANRGCWLANEVVHRELKIVWGSALNWLVGDYVIMPDHLHFFAAPRELDYPFDNWMTYWERQFRKRHDHEDWRWQANPFHHRLRSDESYSQKWQYLRENPIRKGLAKTVDEWPYQGRIHDLFW